MRIQVPLVIEMDDVQLADYANDNGLPVNRNGVPMAAVVVRDVQGYVLHRIQDSPAFGVIGDGSGRRGADVSIKGR